MQESPPSLQTSVPPRKTTPDQLKQVGAVVGCMLCVLYILLLLNAWWSPLIRFESPMANYIVGETLLILPIPLAMIGFRVLPELVAGIIGIPLYIISIPFLIIMFFGMLTIFQIWHFGYDPSMRPCSDSWQGAVRAQAYVTAWGMGGGMGLRVRQEQSLLPGVLLVRDLYDDDYSVGGTVSFVAPDIVHVKPESELHPFNIKLRSFIPLVGPAGPPTVTTRSYNASFFAPLVDVKKKGGH